MIHLLNSPNYRCSLNYLLSHCCGNEGKVLHSSAREIVVIETWNAIPTTSQILHCEICTNQRRAKSWIFWIEKKLDTCRHHIRLKPMPLVKCVRIGRKQKYETQTLNAMRKRANEQRETIYMYISFWQEAHQFFDWDAKIRRDFIHPTNCFVLLSLNWWTAQSNITY